MASVAKTVLQEYNNQVFSPDFLSEIEAKIKALTFSRRSLERIPQESTYLISIASSGLDDFVFLTTYVECRDYFSDHGMGDTFQDYCRSISGLGAVSSISADKAKVAVLHLNYLFHFYLYLNSFNFKQINFVDEILNLFDNYKNNASQSQWLNVVSVVYGISAHVLAMYRASDDACSDKAFMAAGWYTYFNFFRTAQLHIKPSKDYNYFKINFNFEYKENIHSKDFLSYHLGRLLSLIPRFCGDSYGIVNDSILESARKIVDDFSTSFAVSDFSINKKLIEVEAQIAHSSQFQSVTGTA